MATEVRQAPLAGRPAMSIETFGGASGEEQEIVVVGGVKLKQKLISNKRREHSRAGPRRDHETIETPARFKTRANCPSADIAQIRKLLALERKSLLCAADQAEAVNWWQSDYDRMMHDDWLVSRFLLRGQKRAATNQAAGDDDDDGGLYASTMHLIRECAKFRYEFRIDGLMTSAADEFPNEWLDVEGVFDHKPDRAGNPTIYLRVKLHRAKLIETSELRYQFKRLLLYYLEKCDRELTNQPGRGICCVFDLSQASLENLDVELVSWMFKSFKSCSPKILAYIIVYNIPWFLNAALKLLFGTILARSNQQKIRFVHGNELLDYIHPNNLPPYIRL